MIVESKEDAESTRPMATQLTGIDQRIIEAAERAIARERGRAIKPDVDQEVSTFDINQEAQVVVDHNRAARSAIERAREAMAQQESGETVIADAAVVQQMAADAGRAIDYLHDDGGEEPEADDELETASEIGDTRVEARSELSAADESAEPPVDAEPPADNVPEEVRTSTADTSAEIPVHDGLLDQAKQPAQTGPSEATDASEQMSQPAQVIQSAEGSSPQQTATSSQGDQIEQMDQLASVDAPVQAQTAWKNTLVDKVRESKCIVDVDDKADQVLATYLDMFFSEMARCGVTDYVISPGSRSTGLAMKAFERFGQVYVDVDERGAAFFALGLAKARKRPVAVICSSGTAPANWMPALLEAESSRVPVIFLSADRPARLQHLGAPQTCDQIKLFSDHVRFFANMPVPSASAAVLRSARQIALEACVAAYGSHPGCTSSDAGPVHLNFPLDEPLIPASTTTQSLPPANPLPPTIAPGQGLYPRDAKGIFSVFHGKRCVAVCGEGSINSEEDARVLIEFAHTRNIPLLADPISGLRSYDDPFIIDAYDTLLGGDAPHIEVVIRFGRWPISKRLTQLVASEQPVQIVADVRDTRDFTAGTDLLVRTLPVVCAQALIDLPTKKGASLAAAREWVAANDAAAKKLELVDQPQNNDFEGAYVAKLLEMAPADSLVFSANSMSIRAIDTFYRRSDKHLSLLCNRGLNGIDGTLSTAFGAAQDFEQTTVLIGDLAFLHDANALSLQNEMHIRQARGEGHMPCIVVVLLNNNGGAIFDMLPQKSTEDYFGRLFLTPQNMNVKHLSLAFGVDYRRVESVHDFRRVYDSCLGTPGITVIDIPVPFAGVADRYRSYR
ncbi:2-succinyl-5-enolpyruvyl-6-hydroxy-3-cyclohexene-1-carboxylic-acid synthase [Cryptobacterium curtum]|uniref:2-succinyl-5-enolpyruvyl-6-hydroxy-3- cyclohexene-1-carboxylic-acid synthase n=1 Tax=Cryptobacterium curtum TaxID=84163 RepID=UPI0028D74445|nr:2-succinyl-5-enolpyruvyl-6-hydroxy-3-cyclohexene-1-carboxylic-acid synthase [Cryptobacterium curtum]